ncbi:sensor domain-containing diguanylate cyclase [Spirulina sp. CS-785/01]|uniref:sensor domain-containing diguanylate cyclase n=1 Tax=Spirulina sp. CS-785/01 TaxID=3021716 RepID=UPI00232EA5EC|nr:sensor domain-containing diguanylate cyclase [Spirulina sp. CS-785/01]
MQGNLFNFFQPQKITDVFPLLQAAIDSSDSGIFILDGRQKDCIYNQKLLAIWDISEDDIKNKLTPWKLREIAQKLKRPLQFIQFIQATLKQSTPPVEQLFYFKDGKAVRIHANSLYSQAEEIGKTWTFQDITRWIETEKTLRHKNEREQLTRLILKRIRKSLNLSEILQTTVKEVRNLLQTDRVLLYKFHSDWSGEIAVESVSDGWSKTLGLHIYDPCFTEFYIHQYRQGRIHTVTDIYQDDLAPCYVDFLKQFQIRANLALPILQSDSLWGLLLAHHCQGAREWQPSEVQLLKDLADQVAIAIQQAELFNKLQQANQQLQHLAAIDELTQLANRRRFDEYLEREWSRLQRLEHPLSLILADVDYFKRYNDSYGHPAGDDCLQEVARILEKVCKGSTDLVARYGGEEFAIILPNTNTQGALEVAQNIRVILQQHRLIHPNSEVSEYVTLSLGVGSVIPDGQHSPDDLITLADQALYRAKKEGRDRVVLDTPTLHESSP